MTAPAHRNHPAEDAHPAPTPAPVAVPEGGWRDGDQIAVLHGPHLRVLDREGGRWAWSDNGNVVADRPEYFAYNDAIVHVHAPRDSAPRPEPVVAPLPSEASVFPTEAPPAQREQIARLVAAMQLGTEVPPSFVDYATAEAILDAGYRLVPEDDEDTVRVLDCGHIYRDGTRCTLTTAAHREIPGLAALHGSRA